MSHDEDDAMSPRRCRGFFGSPALSGMPQFVVLSTLQWPTRGCPASHLHCPRRKLCCTLFFFASSHWWSYRQLELTQFQNNHRNKKKNQNNESKSLCTKCRPELWVPLCCAVATYLLVHIFWPTSSPPWSNRAWHVRQTYWFSVQFATVWFGLLRYGLRHAVFAAFGLVSELWKYLRCANRKQFVMNHRTDVSWECLAGNAGCGTGWQFRNLSCVPRAPTHVSFNPFTAHQTRFNGK